jgi:hypothetical protein
MANMARKEAPGDYWIGMYNVVRIGRTWIAFNRGCAVAKYPSLQQAHRSLTGEPMSDRS